MKMKSFIALFFSFITISSFCEVVDGVKRGGTAKQRTSSIALEETREKAVSASCINRLKAAGLKLLISADNNGRFPFAKDLPDILKNKMKCPSGEDYIFCINGEEEKTFLFEDIIAFCPHVHEGYLHAFHAGGYVERCKLSDIIASIHIWQLVTKKDNGWGSLPKNDNHSGASKQPEEASKQSSNPNQDLAKYPGTSIKVKSVFTEQMEADHGAKFRVRYVLYIIKPRDYIIKPRDARMIELPTMGGRIGWSNGSDYYKSNDSNQFCYSLKTGVVPEGSIVMAKAELLGRGINIVETLYSSQPCVVRGNEITLVCDEKQQEKR